MTVRANRWLVLSVVLAAYLPIVLDITILHVAVPSITTALGASGTEVLWIIDTYSLIMAGLLVPMGTLADRLGYRRLLTIGLTIFGLASLAASFSPTPAALIAARAVQAIGAAMVMPTVLAIIRRTFSDPKELALAFGIWTTVSAAGAAVGPVVGGALLEHFWWGSIFLVNIPVMLIAVPLVMAILPREVPKPLAGWNIGDALVLLAGVTLGIYAIKSGFKPDASTLAVLAMAAVSLGLLSFFGWRQVSSAEPMLDVSLFSNPAVTVGVMMAMIASASIAGFELVLAQELQYVYGMSPLQAGMFMLPFMIAMAVTGPLAGRLTDSLGLRATASLAMLQGAVAFGGLAVSDIAGSYWIIAFFLVLLGASLSMGLLASSLAIMGSVDERQAGAAGSLETTGYELGAGLGISLFGVLLMSIYGSALRAAMPEGPESIYDSIGSATVLAQQLPNGPAILAAAQDAYSSAHGVVLAAVALLMGALAVVVFVSLKGVSGTAAHSHH